jgi:tRNA A-37 threonylcarbamoyl transferase component Bud32
MFPDARVKALLERWRQSMEREQPISIEELCRDYPELRCQIEEQIAQEQKSLARGTLPTTVDTLLHPVPLPTSSLLPQVPGYEVLEELGHGGMGVVYKARQIHLNRMVALKMIRAGALAAPEQRKRFLAEAKAAAAIEHAGIVRVFDFGTYQGQPFFASELCPNGSLARLLDGKALGPERAATLVEQIAVAVEAAHLCGIVHRDLKPTNILLDAEEQPKIADFGLAKHMEASSDLTPSGAIMGTRSYMAPEQAQARKDVGPLADVWALGAILYECLTGRPPFKAATDYDTLMQVVCDEPVPVRKLQPSVPRDLEAVCLKCLEKVPGQRYACARDLAEDLHRFLHGESVRARPAGPLKRAGRWLKKHAWVGAAAAGIALALVVGLVVGRGRPTALQQGQGLPVGPEEAVPAKMVVAVGNVPKRGEERAVLVDDGRKPGVSLEALLQAKLQPAAARLARQIVERLPKEKLEVEFGEFTGPPGLANDGPRIQQALIVEVKKLGVAVTEGAFWYVKGEHFLIAGAKGQRDDEVILRLEITMRNKKGHPASISPVELSAREP